MTARNEKGRFLLVQGKRTARQASVALLQDLVATRARKSRAPGDPPDIAEAEDGFDALCQLARVRPDIIVMDFSLPRLAGYQVCALVKGSDLFSRTRIVLLADDDSLLDRTRAELAGADAFLVKPYRRAELLQALEG